MKWLIILAIKECKNRLKLKLISVLIIIRFNLIMNMREIEQKQNQKSSFKKQQVIAILTVVFVWILILFLSFSYMLIFAPLMFTYNKLQFWTLIPIIFIVLVLGCYSYFKAIFVSPGYPGQRLNQIYQDQLQDFRHQGRLQNQIKRKRKLISPEILIQNLTYKSYCFKCDNVKLPRTHHCKVCGICITRMDHHCPWIGNCVGKYNHKYFILFQLYTTIGLIIVGVSILADYINAQEMMSRLEDIQRYVIMATAIMSFFLILSIGFLLITQILMVVHNVTTLESFYDQIYEKNPFDTGSMIKNIRQITGESCWFLPTDPFPQRTSLLGDVNQQQIRNNKNTKFQKDKSGFDNLANQKGKNYQGLNQEDVGFIQINDEHGRGNIFLNC